MPGLKKIPENSLCTSLAYYGVKLIIVEHKYTFQTSCSLFFHLHLFLHLHSSHIYLYYPPRLLVSPPRGISVQCRSDAENSPVLFWLHLTLLLVFSCIVRSYSLTSSKRSPVGKTVHKHRRALKQSGRYIFNLTGCRSRVKQQQSALLRIDYLVSVKYKI